jgi:hypothetical protein
MSAENVTNIHIFSDYQRDQLIDLIKHSIIAKIGYVIEDMSVIVEYRGYKEEYEGKMKSKWIPRKRKIEP